MAGAVARAEHHMSDRVVEKRAAWEPRSMWLQAIVLAGVALVLYLASRSASLDDFDSYSFALALDNFDIALQQPQPPGFPVYVVLGRFFDVWLPGLRLALTTLSAVSGALAVGVVFWLGRMLLQRPAAALAAAVIFALSPIQWLTSSKALSDAPGLAVSLLALGALWAGRTDRRWLVAGALLLGLSLGVRAQTNLPGVLLLVWLLGSFLRDRQWRVLALVLAVFALAALVWLVPTVHATGGMIAYYDLVDAHSDHVWERDSLFGAGPISAATLRARIKDFLDTFLVPTLGISVYDDLTASGSVQLALLAVWLGGGLALADWRCAENRLLAFWLLLVVIPLFLFESLNRPRLMLPGLPPLILLTAGGWGRSGDRVPGAAWIVWGAAAAAMLLEGAPLASTLAAEQAPPVQSAATIRANYPADDTLLAAAGSFRTAQVDLPGYRLFYLYAFDADAAAAAVNSGTYRYVAILDRDMFGGAISTLDGNGQYVPVVDRLFSRDPRVHRQHAQVRLQVLTPIDQLSADQLHLPEDGVIDLGGDGDGRFVGQGWFRSESIGGAQARWAGDAATSLLRVSLVPGVDYRVMFKAAAYPDGQTLTVRVNGEAVAQFDLAQDWQEYSFMIRSEQIDTVDITLVELAHTRAESPYDRTEGSSSDRRELAAAYDWLRITVE
jgi:hypothetical protein